MNLVLSSDRTCYSQNKIKTKQNEKESLTPVTNHADI